MERKSQGSEVVENEEARKENENKKRAPIWHGPTGWDFGRQPKQTILPALASTKFPYFIHQ